MKARRVPGGVASAAEALRSGQPSNKPASVCLIRVLWGWETDFCSYLYLRTLQPLSTAVTSASLGICLRRAECEVRGLRKQLDMRWPVHSQV